MSNTKKYKTLEKEGVYDVESDHVGEVYTIDEFIDLVKVGAFIPDDGFGVFGTETHYNYEYFAWSTIPPKDATHVHWFNK